MHRTCSSGHHAKSCRPVFVDNQPHFFLYSYPEKVNLYQLLTFANVAASPGDTCFKGLIHRPPADRRRARERSWPRERDISSGFALHVLVRDTNIQEPAQGLPGPSGQAPAQQSPEGIVTEYLRWMTAFLNVPYEYGG